MIYVLLPAYNEEKGIALVLEKLIALQKNNQSPFYVVVVDDGSKDKTSAVVSSFADRLKIKLFTFEANRGVADVFSTGLKFIVSDSADPQQDICVVLDSDNTQDPSLIASMAQKIREGQDIVIASRFSKGGTMIGCPFVRAVFSYGIAWILRLAIGLPGVKDYSTFYRAYRVSILAQGFERYGDRLLAGKGFAAITALLIKLGNVTKRMCEVPFVLRYDLKGGTSGMKIAKTIRGYIELIAEYWTTNRFRNL